jgi:predicted O-methyltransferase YrrM
MAFERSGPEAVGVGERNAAAAGFAFSSRPEVGRLLRTLASGHPRGRIAESGTGVGVGTAWLQAGLGASASLVTVERDPERAGLAGQLFAADPRVQVLTGDWRLLERHAPFDLFFCDGGGKRDDPEAVISMLAPGGMLVLDDFTPSDRWPPMFEGAPDSLRILYLTHPGLHSVEIRVASDVAVILAVHR